ncbi:hypothetical protein SBRY_110040 [Actinacidiphila bryophytorum]|uniref:Uncharacterized protein n=1 Tax=Actinacidiphila bryophytorum TaxID=1436133 RepID=A0A9W4E3P3_9ACTN|nr:hypothetical protein SBRY_110040 [Actinacidiphila bryophytorum]
MTTHERWSSPPSSPTMVGMAVPTIMLSSIARSMAISRPTMTTRTLRCRGPPSVLAPGAPGDTGSTASVWDMTGSSPVVRAVVSGVLTCRPASRFVHQQGTLFTSRASSKCVASEAGPTVWAYSRSHSLKWDVT